MSALFALSKEGSRRMMEYAKGAHGVKRTGIRNPGDPEAIQIDPEVIQAL